MPCAGGRHQTRAALDMHIRLLGAVARYAEIEAHFLAEIDSIERSMAAAGEPDRIAEIRRIRTMLYHDLTGGALPP